MDVVLTRCAGLAVHKKRITAWRMIPDPTGREAEGMMALRTFGTMTHDLLSWADWLTEASMTHVAMESPGEYGQPGSHLLADPCTVLLVHAAHGKNVPGRKTDQAEARWLATLMRLGLLPASCIPPKGQRDLRALTRSRTKRVHERVREVNRVQGGVERAKIQLASVMADLMGVSGRAMLEALMAGRVEPAPRADRATRRMRSQIPVLEQALTGRVHAHHRQWRAMQLAHLDLLDAQIEALNQAMEASLRARSVDTPSRAGKAPWPVPSPVSPPIASPTLTLTRAVARWDTVPGIDQRGAAVIVAESGMDRSRFATAPRLAAWAGGAPGHDESAGQQRSGTTRKGHRPLRAILPQLAPAAVRPQGTYRSALYQRLAARRGKNRAIVAVAHAIMRSVFDMLSRQAPYHE